MRRSGCRASEHGGGFAGRECVGRGIRKPHARSNAYAKSIPISGGDRNPRRLPSALHRGRARAVGRRAPHDPGVGPSGVQADGSLLCVWRDPRTDTTAMATKILYMSRGPALDMLNGLANNEGFTCFTPDGGTRCEKTWPDPTYPVTDGRTLFWRDEVLIDTTYSNLAPSGYTSSIVAYMFD